jgi:hypothetical protein
MPWNLPSSLCRNSTPSDAGKFLPRLDLSITVIDAESN